MRYLFNATFCCCWVGGDPIQEESSSSSLKEEGAAWQEVVDSFWLILGSVASKSRGNLLQLLNCNRVKPPQGFGHNWDELQAFSSAELCCPPHFVGVGHCCSVPWCSCRPWCTCRPCIFELNIYLDICLYQNFDTNIFGYSFVFLRIYSNISTYSFC